MPLVDAPISHERNPEFSAPDQLLAVLHKFHQQNVASPTSPCRWNIQIELEDCPLPITIPTYPESHEEPDRLGIVVLNVDTNQPGTIVQAQVVAEYDDNGMPITKDY